MAQETVTESPMFIVKQKMTGVDFISSLPDEVIHHILSFTPTKYCIRTSVLSKRWKTLWYSTSCISIDCSTTDLIIPVDKTLRSFLSPKIKSFDLSICYGVCASWINSWIELAMSRNVENFSLNIKAMYRLPDSFFVNSDMKKLHLTLSRFQPSSGRASLSSLDIVPKCTISWSSLRELILNSCDLPDQSFAKIIAGCSMLETLILNLCRRLHHLDLSKSPNLRRVEIYFGIYQNTELDEIIAPQIHYLKLAGCFRPCSLKDVSSLTEIHYSLNDHASLYIDLDVDFDFVQDTVVKMLASLQHAKKLTLQGVILQILSIAKLCGVPFPKFNTEELIVETMLVQAIMPGVTELLRNSHNLKKITIYPMKCNAIADKELEKHLKTKCLNPYECWSGFFPMVEPTGSYFNGSAEDEKSEYVVSFMELVLRNSENLEMMVLRLEGYLGRREYRNLPPLIPTAFQNKNGKAKEIFKNFKIIP